MKAVGCGDGELRHRDVIIKMLGVSGKYEELLFNEMRRQGFKLIDLDTEPNFDKDECFRIFYNEHEDFIPQINRAFGEKRTGEMKTVNHLECSECGDTFEYRGRYAGQLTLIYALGENICPVCLEREGVIIYGESD